MPEVCGFRWPRAPGSVALVGPGLVPLLSFPPLSLSPGDFCHGWQLGEGDGVQEGLRLRQLSTNTLHPSAPIPTPILRVAVCAQASALEPLR